MESRFGFTRFSVAEFEPWLRSISVGRQVNKIQQHHTWSPKYAHFTGGNHFELQKGMRDYHVNHNGWADIGQHFSIFPDGAIVTGRSLNMTPACIFNNNAGSVCIENVGDFDTGKDAMTATQRGAIVQATVALARKFNLNPVTTNNIVYHHWYDLNSGARTDGAGTTKSCPGTAFFGGNSVAACRAHFLPLVQQGLDGAAPAPAAPAFGCVITETLNVRSAPGADQPLSATQGPLQAGTIVRVYGERDGWLKIAATGEHWVFAKWIAPVVRHVVNTDDSKGRTGPGTAFETLKAFMRGDEVFVHEERANWSRVGLDPLWINSALID